MLNYSNTCYITCVSSSRLILALLVASETIKSLNPRPLETVLLLETLLLYAEPQTSYPHWLCQCNLYTYTC